MRARSAAIALLALAAACVARAESGTLSVSAVVLSKSVCRITGATTMTLAFGAIDAASTANATASITNTIRCLGSDSMATYSIVAGNGQNPLGAGNRRMRHATIPTELLSYSLSITPSSASIPKGSTQVITITGTITPPQFQDVRVGGYSDTVEITLNP